MPADRGPVSFGSKLRDARERRGVSLRNIANATKISLTALEALERNDITRLPGGIFSRAFVRSYAVEVGLDPETTIQQFIAEFPNESAVTAGHPTSDRGDDHDAIESERLTAATFLRLAMVGVPLAAVVVYFSSMGRQPARNSAEPPSSTLGTSPAQRGPSDAAPPAGAPSPNSSTDGARNPERSGAEGTAGAATDTAAASVGSRAAPQPPATTWAAVSTGAASDASAGDRLTIGLSVRRPCWVSATVDGRKTIERLLRPGDPQSIDVRREMVLTAADAAAITLTFNGAEGRPLGKAGEVVTARFNPSNFKHYLLTR